MVNVFLSGTSYLTGHLDQDPERIVGMTSSQALGIPAEMGAIVEVEYMTESEQGRTFS